MGQARLGLNDSGMSQEHIEMQIELSKSRMDIILARMRARQEGRDPDEVAPDPFSSTNDTSRLGKLPTSFFLYGSACPYRI